MAMRERFDAGGFLSTDVESVDLGRHHGIHLEGEIVRRRLRIGVGGRRGVRIELGRARATSIRAIGAEGDIVHRFRPNPDPWVEAAQRLVALTVATSLLPMVLRQRSRFAQRAAE